MARFLAIVLPLLVLLLALSGPALDSFGGVEPHGRLPAYVAAGGQLVEALALTALFLLIQGRSGRWWMDGAVTGLIAWVFRGPVLVLSVVALTGQGSEPWWSMSIRWLVVYLVCGVALAVAARSLGLER